MDDNKGFSGGAQTNSSVALSIDTKNAEAPPAPASVSGELTPADLIRLLSCLEGELQARDLFISGLLKSQTSRQLLLQAKYGRLGLSDPFAALQRDSETSGEPDGAFDESSVSKMYETQLGQLEKLIAVQRRAHLRAKQVLAAAEKKHARTVREWDEERQRRRMDAAQSDDVCMMLEKERERLKEELEAQKVEQEKLKAEIGRLNRLMTDEKERRKQIVLCLLQDRRKLAILFSEERTKVQALLKEKAQQKPDRCSNCAGQLENNLEEMVKKLTAELEGAKSAIKREKEENASLRETLLCQESDLNLIRETILAKSKKISVKGASGSAVYNHGEPMSFSDITGGRSYDVIRHPSGTISHRAPPVPQPHQNEVSSRKSSLPSPQPAPSLSPLLRYRAPSSSSYSTPLQQSRVTTLRLQTTPFVPRTLHSLSPTPIVDHLLIPPPRRSQSVRTNLGTKVKSPTSESAQQTAAPYSPHNLSPSVGRHPPMHTENLPNNQKLSVASAHPQQTTNLI